MFDVPRERAPHSAVASAAPPVRFRCRRRRFLASVRSRRAAATPCCQRKRRAYLMTRDQTRAPVTCVRTALPAPSSRRRDLGHDVPLNAVKLFPFSPSSRQALLCRGALRRRPTELRSVNPHAMHDHADLARERDPRALRPATLGHVHPPAFERRKPLHPRQ
jgi:hypothetical protein